MANKGEVTGGLTDRTLSSSDKTASDCLSCKLSGGAANDLTSCTGYFTGHLSHFTDNIIAAAVSAPSQAPGQAKATKATKATKSGEYGESGDNPISTSHFLNTMAAVD
jgi:hypothetical protein